MPDLAADVPGIDALLTRFRGELRALEGFGERRLVHGDYFPGNCYIDETLAVCGVGDFGYTTVAGDPLLDTAGAIFYLEVSDGYREQDTPLLLALAAARHGREAMRQIDLYRRYCALYFSVCKRDDPRTYAWSVRHIRRAGASPP
jgi:aminoglycoside phosphotransferase (APT) family kinase protein